jgi:hypothetical protein
MLKTPNGGKQAMKTRLAVEDVPAEPDLRQSAGLRTDRLVAQVKQLPEVRADKVRQMRRLILLGRLDTPERIVATARKVAEELGLAIVARGLVPRVRTRGG